MKVLIVPDKFKGTLRAGEAAEAIAAGWREVRSGDELELLPMSDGGDGFGEIVGSLLQARLEAARTVNAAHDSIETNWWWSEQSQTAVVESASVIGLAMLPPGRFHPFELDTFGLGQLLAKIDSQFTASRLFVGIGGSSTNDGGFGMARALGFRFFDSTNRGLDRWVELDRLAHIEQPHLRVRFTEVIIATDVRNPLLGSEGATRVYGRQKGLRSEDFPIAERCLGRLAEVVHNDLGLDCADLPGAGAAGGLGFGLHVFLNGRLEPGFEIFSRLSRLRDRVRTADLVITAEGAIDAQSEMGKGTGAVAQLAAEEAKRCVGLAGHVPEANWSGLFELALGIHPHLTSLDHGMAEPAPWLRKLAAEAARKIV